MKKHGRDQLRCHYLYVTHSVRSSPSVGIFTSGRVRGGAVRDDDLGLGSTSIVKTIATINADKVTAMSLSIMGSRV